MQDIKHECTSWLVFSDLTRNNTNILHKNRDSPKRNIAVLLNAENARYKWVGLGCADEGRTSGSPTMGINEAGLASVMNSGEKCIDNGASQQAKRTPEILEAILDSCGNADEALELLGQFVKNNDYFHEEHGSIFFFMDKDSAYIAEMSAHFISPQRYDHGYALRANIWHNQDMAAYADNNAASFLDSANREFIVIKALNDAIRKRGNVTVEDCLDISRISQYEVSPFERQLCYKTTNSTSTLELDREYPGLLSTAYVLIGPPRHTICVPIPICTREIHPKMLSQAWCQAAWKRFDDLGFGAEIPQAWLEFENYAFAEYREAQGKARTLMKEGRRHDAEILLQNTAKDIWDGASELLF